MKNNKFRIFISITALSFFLISGLALAQVQKENKKLQTTCPVSGEKIDKNFSSVYQCQRIYFSSAASKEDFKKDPEKYMKKIEDENILLESVQEFCPITGKPINKTFYKDYKGRRVYFSSASCIAEFDKDPNTNLKKLYEQAKMLKINAKKEKEKAKH